MNVINATQEFLKEVSKYFEYLFLERVSRPLGKSILRVLMFVRFVRFVLIDLDKAKIVVLVLSPRSSKHPVLET